MDIVEYTHNEIKKNLALLETHLKQASFSDKDFCKECIEKHILILEGLAEEGITVCENCDIDNYKQLLFFLKCIKKDMDFQKDGLEMAKEIRKLRKSFIACDEETGMKDREDIKKKIAELEQEKELAKDIISQDRLEYAKYILNWVLRGKRCSDN